MKTRIKAAAALTVIVALSGLLRTSTPVPVRDTQVMAPPAQTVPAATQPVTKPDTVPTTVPVTAVPTTIPVSQPFQEESGFTAAHAFVYRCADQTFSFLKGSLHERIFPASITKLFTAYVALLYLEPEQQVCVDDTIYSTPCDSSFAQLSTGDILTTRQLVYGMLLASGGDAARMMAAAAGRVIAGNPGLAGGDAMAVFMAEMNRQAALLGMTDSHFATPDGYHDENHYTSMADLITLGTLCLETDVIRQAAAATQYTLTLSGREITWKNTNMLLHADSLFSDFYIETAVGMKTGYTAAAGRCLLSAFVIDGNYILAGVFGCPDPDSTFIPQFLSTCFLYQTYIAP